MAYFRCGGGTNPTGNATSADVLATKTFSNEADGIDQVGSMPNNGAVDVDLDTSTTSYTVPAGYHNGSGTVKLTTETKTETAGTSAKTVTPTSGKVLSSVTINPTPSQTKSCTPTISAQTISPDSGKLLSSVSVSAIQTQTKSATPTTSSQNITPDSGKYLTKVTVGAISTQTKTATPTTSSQDITPDSGKYLTKVSVSAIQTETKTSTPTTRSATADTVTPTSGKYLTSVTVNTKSVPNSNSGTYTFPSGSTGATYDMGSTNTIRKVNASNVYAKGKADAKTSDFSAFTSKLNSVLVPTHRCIFPDGKLHILSYTAVTNNYSVSPGSLVFKEDTNITNSSSIGLGDGCVLFKNEVHLFGHSDNYTQQLCKTYHYKISGSSLVSVDSPQHAFVTFCVFNNELYAAGDLSSYGTYSGVNRKAFYKWNGSTWTQLANLPVDVNTIALAKLHVIGSTLYLLYKSSSVYMVLYKWSGSAWSKVKDITMPNSYYEVQKSCVYNNLIYVFAENGKFATINASGTVSSAYNSVFSAHSGCVVFDNKIFVWSGENGKGAIFGVSTSATAFTDTGTFYEYVGS